MTDEEIIQCLRDKSVALYELEKKLDCFQRAVLLRRQFIAHAEGRKSVLKDLPFDDFYFDCVFGQCCENVIGYVPIPVGVVGPLIINQKMIRVPFATTEGCLVASANRGCACIRDSIGILPECSGVNAYLTDDGMTRASVISTSSLSSSRRIAMWIDEPMNFNILAAVFNATSKYAKLTSVKCKLVGNLLFLRFKASTGEAMGMNMISKGAQKCLNYLKLTFDDMQIVSISGNYCTDKKSSAINWIEGRGKSIVAEATLPNSSLLKVLKVSASRLVEIHVAKNLIGSSIAGTLGGNNAHAANVVAAVFAATGQDIAHVVDSSQCLIHMELGRDKSLHVSCTMPCVEVGVIGGGTILPAQKECLNLMNLQEDIGGGSQSANLALIIGGTVIAAEVSLLASLATGDLVKSHMKMNRRQSKNNDCAEANCTFL